MEKNIVSMVVKQPENVQKMRFYILTNEYKSSSGKDVDDFLSKLQKNSNYTDPFVKVVEIDL